MVVVSTSGTGNFADYARGGLALERMWLTATQLGWSLQPWTPVFSYAASQNELAQVLGEARAQLMYPKGRAALAALGLREGVDHFIMALRIHAGPPPSAISERM